MGGLVLPLGVYRRERWGCEFANLCLFLLFWSVLCGWAMNLGDCALQADASMARIARSDGKNVCGTGCLYPNRMQYRTLTKGVGRLCQEAPLRQCKQMLTGLLIYSVSASHMCFMTFRCFLALL